MSDLIYDQMCQLYAMTCARTVTRGNVGMREAMNLGATLEGLAALHRAVADAFDESARTWVVAVEPQEGETDEDPNAPQGWIKDEAYTLYWWARAHVAASAMPGWPTGDRLKVALDEVVQAPTMNNLANLHRAIADVVENQTKVTTVRIPPTPRT